MTFAREGSRVIAKIEGKYRVFSFSWNADSEWAAELLRDNLDEHLRALVRDIREEEYTAGWTAARKRRPRRTWFSTLLRRGLSS